ncbi:MAG: FkbM family methyltransferase [Ruminococcus sp.]|nr:FkbM family methyltransferase [Ruminococcus sp.]
MDGLYIYHDFFLGLESVWDRLKNCGKPIYMYGGGNGGEKILRACNENGICISGIFASDDFSADKSFWGYKVKRLSEIESEAKDLVVVLAFGTDIPEVMERIDRIGKKHELFAPDVSVAGTERFEKKYFMENFRKAAEAYSLLSDSASREVFVDLTAYKITGRLEYLRKAFSTPDESERLLMLGENEIYCDLGAYNGDTVRQFAERTGGRYKKIYAVEPEKRNFQKCVKSCLGFENISFYNAAAWSADGEMLFEGGSGRQARLGSNGRKIPVRSLDSILGGEECTYIKYDVEGADIPSLDGSAFSISGYAPKICCAVYHRCYDYIKIPLHINRLRSGYKFYMRQYPYYPAWETNIFCISGK